MKVFVPINPKTGRTIGADLHKKQDIRYQYRDTETKHFIGKNEFRRRYRAYKNSLIRKDKRQSVITDKAVSCGYSAYNRTMVKTACRVEIIGVWADESNIKWHKGHGI